MLPRMMRWLLAIGLVAVCASRAGADTIQEIIVEDNEKTTSDTIELIARIEVGDEFTPELVDVIKARLVTSGLFKDVEVFYEPVPGGARVHLLVRDKHSWVIAPAFYTQPTNVGGGIGFGENNLFGLNQKLLLYAQIATGDTYFVGAWVLPNIGGTRFYAQVDTYDAHTRTIEYAEPTKYLTNPVAVRRAYMNYYNTGIRVGYDIYRGLKLDTRLRAAYVNYTNVELDTQDNPGVTPGDANAPDAASVSAPGKSGWDVSNEITLTLDHRANWYGIASGGKYTLTFEHSVLDSDFHYYEFNASLYKAWPLFETHNLVVKAHADVGYHMPFQVPGRRHRDARLAEQPISWRHAGTRQRGVFGAAVRDRGPPVSRHRILGFRLHDIPHEQQSRAQLPAEFGAAGVGAVQELGRRRHAAVLAPDRAAAARLGFRLRPRGTPARDLSRDRSYRLT